MTQKLCHILLLLTLCTPLKAELLFSFALYNIPTELPPHKVARVVDSLRVDAVVLMGFKGRDYIGEVMESSLQEYNTLYREMDYYSQGDIAMLYHSDIFRVTRVAQAQGYYLYIGGDVAGRSIGIHTTFRGDRLLTTLPPHSNEADDHTIVCGKFTKERISKLGLRAVSQPHYSPVMLGCDSSSLSGLYTSSFIYEMGGDFPVYVIFDSE